MKGVVKGTKGYRLKACRSCCVYFLVGLWFLFTFLNICISSILPLYTAATITGFSAFFVSSSWILRCIIASSLVWIQLYFWSMFLFPAEDLEVFTLGSVTATTLQVWIRSPMSPYVQVAYQKTQSPNESPQSWTHSQIERNREDRDFTRVIALHNVCPTLNA